MTPDPLAPDLERQRRVVGVGTLVRLAEPGHRTIDAGRAQVDLAHLGRVAVADLGGASAAGSQAAPRVQRAASARPAGRGPKPRTTAVLVGSLSPGRGQLEPAGQHRVARRSRRARGRSAGTCRAAGWTRHAGRRAPPARPACRGRRAARAPPPTGPVAGQRRVEGVGDDGQIGQFGHGSTIVVARKACARLSRPREAGQLKSDEQAMRPTKERTADRSPTDHLIVSEDGLSVAQAVRDSRAQIHNQE